MTFDESVKEIEKQQETMFKKLDMIEQSIENLHNENFKLKIDNHILKLQNKELKEKIEELKKDKERLQDIIVILSKPDESQ